MFVVELVGTKSEHHVQQIPKIVGVKAGLHEKLVQETNTLLTDNFSVFSYQFINDFHAIDHPSFIPDESDCELQYLELLLG